jgi:hypothetical protein
VERPDALSSDALPFREGADASFSFAPSFAADVVAGLAAVFAAGFATGFAVGFATSFAPGFDVAPPAGGAYFAVLFYRDISLIITRR